jgi:hypothetical protein
MSWGFRDLGNKARIESSGSFLELKQTDLTGIKKITFFIKGGSGKVDLHASSPTGKLIATGSYTDGIIIPEGQGIADLFFVFDTPSVTITSINFLDSN